MDKIPFNWERGTVDLVGDERKKFEADFNIFASSNVDDVKEGHAMFAKELRAPISYYFAYASWIGYFFQMGSASIGHEMPYVPILDYATAATGPTTPVRTPLYDEAWVRFTGYNNFYLQTGVQQHMDVEAATGVPLLNDLMQRAGYDMARKLDSIMVPLLVAAIPAAQKITAASFTSNVFDTIKKSSVEARYKVDFVVMNESRALDMKDWTIPVNWAWGTLPNTWTEEIVREGYVTNYFGTQIIIDQNLPSNKAYFASTNPASRGRYLDLTPLREMSEVDIRLKRTVYTWDQYAWYSLVDALDVWEVTFA